MSAWAAYLERFHAERAGITEAVLTGAADEHGADPYDWLADGVGPGARVVDLACGSAPLCARLRARAYVGVDRSPAELALARHRCRQGRFVLGDAARLPVAGPVDAVVCSMSLQVLVPLAAVLGGVAAVLRPGGPFVATVPGKGALTVADRVRWLRLLVALRRRLSYPNDAALAEPGPLLESAGMAPVADEERRFGLRLADRADAQRLVASLYLPDTDAKARLRALDVAAGWCGPDAPDLGISIRRITALRC